ncbi:hypothetical protein M9Y10_035572 [Tritrichomonas musculus]|uniref:Viral A-type inclusion protein n=1 Tax=Tritrichomonas musculus TaxID=1915356 RepID=A0ABR2GWW2_9EUKA
MQKTPPNVQSLPSGEEDKDTVINNLQTEIKTLQTYQNKSQDKLNEGVSKVEEQLNIPIQENTEDQNLDLFDRILRVGSNVRSLHDQITDQIVDILERGFQDVKFLQDTLYNIKEKLEGSANIPTEDIETQEIIQNIRKIAFDLPPEPEELQKALQKSVMIHQDSESKIKYFQGRISDLEQQINFYIESGQNPGNESTYEFGTHGDLESSSFYSAFPLSANNSPRRHNISKNDASSFRSQRYHKPHSSISPDSIEQMDNYALQNSLRQQVELEYSDKISQLSAQLNEAESKREIQNNDQKVLNSKLSTLQKKYKELEAKYKKLLAQQNQKSPNLEKANLAEQIKKLTADLETARKTNKSFSDQVKATKAELEKAKSTIEGQTKELNDTKLKSKKIQSAYLNLKKKSDAIEQENKNLKLHQSPSVTDRNITLDVLVEEDKTHKVQQTLSELNEQNKKQKEYLINIRKALGLPTDDIESNQTEDFFNKDIIDKVSRINKEFEVSKDELDKIKENLGISKIPSTEDDANGQTEENQEGTVINQITKYQKENEELKSKLKEVHNTFGMASDEEEAKTKLEEISKARQHLQQLITAVKGSEEPVNVDNLTEEELNQIIKEAKQDKEITDSIKSALPESGEEMSIEQTKAKLEEATKARQQLQQMIAAIKGNEEPVNIDNLTEEDLNQIINEAKQDKAITDSIKSALPENGEEMSIEQTKAKLAEATKARQQLQQLISAVKGSDQPVDIDNLTEEDMNKIINEAKQDKEITESVRSALPEGNEEMSIEQTKAKLEEATKARQQLQQLISAVKGSEEPVDIGNLTEEDMNKIVKEAKQDKEITESIKSALPESGEEMSIEQTKAKLEEATKTRQQLQQLISAVRGSEEPINIDNLTEEDLNKIVKEAKQDKEITDSIKSALPEGSEEMSIEQTKAKLEEATKARQQLQQLISAVKGSDQPVDIDNLTEEDMNKIVKEAKQDKEITDSIKSALPESGEEMSIEQTKAKLEEATKARQQLQQMITAIKGNEEPVNIDNLTEEELNQIINEAKQDKEVSDSIKSSLSPLEGQNGSKTGPQSFVEQVKEANKEKEKMKETLDAIAKSLGIRPEKLQQASESSAPLTTEELCSEIQKAVQEQVAENREIREALGEETEEAKGGGEGEAAKQPKDIKAALKKQKEENEILKKNLQSVLSTLGLPPLKEKEDGSLDLSEKGALEQQCSVINNEIEKMKNRKEKLQKEMRTLKESLGLEEEETRDENQLNEDESASNEPSSKKKQNVSEVILNTTKENNELKEQLKNMRELLGLQAEGTEGEEGKDKQDIVTRINEINEENKILKEQVQEMCKMLGIPDITTEASNEMSEDNKRSPTQRFEEATKEIKNKLGKLQEENEIMKNQIIKMAESVGVDASQLNEEMTAAGLQEQCENIKTRIDKVQQNNTTLREQNDSIRNSLGLPPITDEELETATKSREAAKATEGDQASQNIEDPLVTKLQQMKNNVESIQNTLGIDPTSSSTEAIQGKAEQLKHENEHLIEENNKLRKALGLPPIEAHKEQPGKEGSTNANEQEDNLDNVYEQAQEQRKENEILKKHLQDIVSTLGLPPLKEKEDGSLDLSEGVSLETQCNNIKKEVEQIKNKKDKLQQEMRLLKESLGLEEEEETQDNSTTNIENAESNKEKPEKKKQNVSEVILNTTKENNELKEQLKNMRELLGLQAEGTEGEEGKDKQDIVTRINEINEENKILKEQVQEMCKMLGIPDITTEASNEISEDNKRSPTQRFEEATKEIKNKLGKLQEENEIMKNQIIKMAESVGVDASQLNEEMTAAGLQEQCENIKTRIDKVQQNNTTLREQNDSIRNSLGLPPITDEELEIAIKSREAKLQGGEANEANDKADDPLLAHLKQMKNNVDSIQNSLGIDPTSSSTEAIQGKAEQLKQENEHLIEEINKHRKALGLPPIEAHKEQPGKEVSMNANEQEENLKNVYEQAQEQRKENEILKKHLQDIVSTLGLPPLKEKEDGSLDLSEGVSLETQCNNIKKEVEQIKNKKDKLQQEMRLLKESLGLEEEEEAQDNSESNKGSTDSQANSEKKKQNVSEIIINTTKENNELKEQLKNMRELLGLQPEGTEGEEGSNTEEVVKSLQSQKELFNELGNLLQDVKLDHNENESGKPLTPNEAIIQKIKALTQEKADLQNAVNISNVSNKIQKSEYEEIASLLFNSEGFNEAESEFGVSESDGESKPESKIVRAIKYLKKRHEQAEDELNQTIEKVEQNKKDLSDKLSEKEKEFNEIKQKLIETQSKNSGIIEERSAFQNNLMKSLQEALNEAVNSPEGKDSPVYIKLNDISQEIMNQQNMIGELANDKEKLVRLEKLEDERSQILDSLQIEGYLSPRERKETNVASIVQRLIDSSKKNGNNDVILERFAELNQSENDEIGSKQTEKDPVKRLINENGDLKAQLEYLKNRFNVSENEIHDAIAKSRDPNYQSPTEIFKKQLEQMKEKPETVEALLEELGVDTSKLTPEEKQQIILQCVSNAHKNEQEIRHIMELPPGNSIVLPSRPQEKEEQRNENEIVFEEEEEDLSNNEVNENKIKSNLANTKNELVEAIDTMHKQNNIVTDGTIHLCNTLNLLPTKSKQTEFNEEEMIHEAKISPNEIDQELMNKLNNKVSSMSKEALILRSQVVSLADALGIEGQERTNAQDLIEEVTNRISEINKEKEEAKTDLEEIQKSLGICKSGDKQNQNQSPHSFAQEIINAKKENEVLKTTLNKLCQQLGIPSIEESSEQANEKELIEEKCNQILGQLSNSNIQGGNKSGFIIKDGNPNEIMNDLSNLFEQECQNDENSNQKEPQQITKENFINKVKGQATAFNKLRSAMKESQGEEQNNNSNENMTEEELADKIIQMMNETKELQQTVQTQEEKISQLTKEEEKKKIAVHKLSLLLDPFIKYSADASSELLESEASFSQDEEEEKPTNKNRNQGGEKTLDEIVEDVTNLTEQVRSLLHENSNLSVENNSIKVSDVSMKAYSEERNILSSLLLAAKDSDDSDDLEEEELNKDGELKLVSALKKLHRHQNKLKSKLDEASSNKEKLENELKQVQKDNEATSNENEQLKEKVEKLESEKNEKQKMMNTIIEERAAFETRIQDIIQNNSQQSSPLVDQLMSLSTELSKQQQQNKNFEKQTFTKLDEVDNKLNVLLPVKEKSAELNIDSDGNLINSEDELNGPKLISSYKKMKGKNQELNEQLIEMKAENEKLQEEIRQLGGDPSNTKSDEIKRLKEEISQLQKKKKKSSSNNDENVEFEEEEEDLSKDDLKPSSETIHKLQQKIKELQAKLDEVEEERKQILKSLGIGKQGNDEDEEDQEIENQPNKIAESIQRMKNELSKRLDEVADLKKQLDESASKIQQLQQQQKETLLAIARGIDDDDLTSFSPAIQTELIENLEELRNQIGHQNEDINQAMIHGESSEEMRELEEKIQARKREPHAPVKKPQNALLESLKKFQADLNEATRNNAEKDCKIEELETKISDLEKERRAILHELGLSEKQNEEEEEEVFIDITSPIYMKIQEMKENESALKSEIETLKRAQQNNANTIQELKNERQKIMQALYGCDDDDENNNENNCLDNSELIDNLDSLNKSITEQNETINAAIVQEPSDEELSASQLSPLPSPVRRQRIQRPQNQVLSALKKIRNELKEATNANFDKDIRIEELESQLREYEENGVPAVQSRSVNINSGAPENNIFNELKEKIIQLEKQIENLQEEKQTAEQQIEKLSNETQKLKELNGNIDKLDQMIEKFENEKKVSENQVNFLKDEIQKEKKFIQIIGESIDRSIQLMGITSNIQGEEGVVDKAKKLENQLLSFISKTSSELTDSSISLEKKLKEQEEAIEVLKGKNQALTFEKNAVMSVLGIHDDNNQESSEEELLLARNDSLLFKEVQNMTQRIDDQLNQIEKLKQDLIKATKTIEQLSEERGSIMQALMPSDEKLSDYSTGDLFRNLESLGHQISKQNEDMNTVIEEEITLDASTDSVASSSPSVCKSPQREPKQRPHNFILEALKKIRSQLEEAQQEVSNKEIKIAELENEIDSLKKE